MNSKLLIALLAALGLTFANLGQHVASAQSTFPLGSPPSQTELDQAARAQVEADQTEQLPAMEQPRAQIRLSESVQTPATPTGQTADATASISLATDQAISADQTMVRTGEPRLHSASSVMMPTAVAEARITGLNESGPVARVANAEPINARARIVGQAQMNQYDAARDNCELEFKTLHPSGSLGLKLKVPEKVELVEVVPSGEYQNLKLKLGLAKPGVANTHVANLPHVQQSITPANSTRPQAPTAKSPFQRNPFYQGRVSRLEPIYPTESATTKRDTAPQSPVSTQTQPELNGPQTRPRTNATQKQTERSAPRPLLPITAVQPENGLPVADSNMPAAKLNQVATPTQEFKQDNQVHSLKSILNPKLSSRAARAGEVAPVSANLEADADQFLARQLLHNAAEVPFVDQVEVFLTGPEAISFGEYADFIVRLKNRTAVKTDNFTVVVDLPQQLRVDVIDRRAVFDAVNNRLTFSVAALDASDEVVIRYRATAESKGLLRQSVEAFASDSDVLNATLLSDVVGKPANE